MEKGRIWRNLEAPWAQDRSDQRHPREVETDWGNVHIAKGAVGRLAAPSSRLSHLISPLHGSGCAQARLTATAFSVYASEEQFILSQVALLEQVEALVPMLDSTHIKGTSLGLQLHYSTWGGGWMGRTSLGSG